MDRLFDIGFALVMVALATTLVAHPNTSKVVKATGDAFTDSLLAAQGKG